MHFQSRSKLLLKLVLVLTMHDIFATTLSNQRSINQSCLVEYLVLSHSDSMVVGFITTYAISAYHHYRCEFESRSGEVYSIQHYVIKLVSDLL